MGNMWGKKIIWDWTASIGPIPFLDLTMFKTFVVAFNPISYVGAVSWKHYKNPQDRSQQDNNDQPSREHPNQWVEITSEPKVKETLDGKISGGNTHGGKMQGWTLGMHAGEGCATCGFSRGRYESCYTKCLGSPLLRFKPEESLASGSCKQLIKEAAVGGIKSRFLPTSLIAGECARKAVPLPVSVPEVVQQDTAPSPRRSCSLCASGRGGRGGRGKEALQTRR